MVHYFTQYNPFEQSEYLRNIVTGLTSATSNVTQTREVGFGDSQKMYGCDAYQFSFSRKSQVKQIEPRKTIKN